MCPQHYQQTSHQPRLCQRLNKSDEASEMIHMIKASNTGALSYDIPFINHLNKNRYHLVSYLD